jgi:hypothetical protein
LKNQDIDERTSDSQRRFKMLIPELRKRKCFASGTFTDMQNHITQEQFDRDVYEATDYIYKDNEREYHIAARCQAFDYHTFTIKTDRVSGKDSELDKYRKHPELWNNIWIQSYHHPDTDKVWQFGIAKVGDIMKMCEMCLTSSVAQRNTDQHDIGHFAVIDMYEMQKHFSVIIEDVK